MGEDTRDKAVLMNDQRSLTDQLADLAAIADREGMYDAADFLREQLVKPRRYVEAATAPREATASPEKEVSDG